tara:strand:- start:3 stop:290 length:288 start_codon:yes stop_codon:yes gene_type:complete
MTPEVLDELAAKAEAATPGPWVYDGARSVLVPEEYRDPTTGRRDGVHWKPNAAHIAAFDPPTVLALIAEVRRLQAELARERFGALVALHPPVVLL